MRGRDGFRHAVLLMSATSLLVPLVGLLTAPILTNSLGVAGRGEAAAAMAPNALIASVATLGLPEALTFHIARRPGIARRAIGIASAVGAGLGALCFIVVFVLAGVLAGGDTDLAALIVLGVALSIPLLIVNLLRGAAFGRRLFTAISLERIINSGSRLLALASLAVADQLTVVTAVLVMALGPVVAGVAYWRLLLPSSPTPGEDEDRESEEDAPVGRPLIGYGSRVWLGSVAGMLTARLGALLVTPLSDVQQLGLLIVAVTVADVPFIVATSVRDVLFGFDSSERDAPRAAMTTRLSTCVALLGSAAIGLSLPLWIAPLFGAGFEAALLPTWILLAATVANVPGWMAGAVVSAWGRPALRSVGLIGALVVNVVALVLLTPPYGATGAALGALLGAVTLSVVTVLTSARLTGAPTLAFIVPRASDVGLLRRGVVAAIRRLRRRGA